MYITYSEYKLMGGLADNSATFNKIEMKAEKQIDQRTFNRLKNQTIPNEVKQCMVELIDLNMQMEDSDSTISSINNDGVSVSFVDKKEIESKINDIVQLYLGNVVVNNKKLTYRGIYADDYI